VIVSESVARRYFRDENPLGRQILFRKQASTIVGVVKDIRYASLRAEAPLVTYHPARQESDTPATTFLLRTSSASAETLSPFLREAVRAVAPALPAPSVVSLDDRVAGGLRNERVLAALSGGIAMLAAVLAAIGIHGTIAAAVARRQREIGVRIALGAVPAEVARMVVADTFRTVAGGLAIGVPAALVGALVAPRVLTDVLFDLSPADPTTLCGTVVAILLIAVVASYLPARHASRMNPVAAINAE
jgi:ABC-type antimicrobial peptide transport system permease subunit